MRICLLNCLKPKQTSVNMVNEHVIALQEKQQQVEATLRAEFQIFKKYIYGLVETGKKIASDNSQITAGTFNPATIPRPSYTMPYSTPQRQVYLLGVLCLKRIIIILLSRKPLL